MKYWSNDKKFLFNLSCKILLGLIFNFEKADIFIMFCEEKSKLNNKFYYTRKIISLQISNYEKKIIKVWWKRSIIRKKVYKDI